MTRRRPVAIRRPLRLVLALVVMLPAAAAWAPAAAAQDPVIAAAGDIACAPGDPVTADHAATSRRRPTCSWAAPLAAVLPLGDIQYNSASLSQHPGASYDPTWGRVKSISRPIIGNHEGSGTGYFDYFNGAGCRGRPGRAARQGLLQLRRRHLAPGRAQLELRRAWPARPARSRSSGCAPTSPRIPPACTLAYWHHPRYSSGHDGDNTFMQPLWEALDDAGAEIVLSGHSHNYERFAPVDRNGTLEPGRGHPPVRGGHGRRVLHRRAGHAEPAQRGRAERHLRRAVPDAAPDELRLAVRSRGGQDVHRFRQHCVSSAHCAASAAASATGRDGADHLEGEGLAGALPGRAEARRQGRASRT